MTHWAADRTVAAPGSSGEGPLPPAEATAPFPKAKSVSLLGVDYLHVKTEDGGDLYLTRFGQRFAAQLQPPNWFDQAWFASKRQRLIGTSTIYRVPTKPVNGRSLDLVVRYCRVGEEVPVDTVTINKFIHAEFNSPFEEFAAVMELRTGGFGPPVMRVRTQKPLAIYAPPQRLELWQTGRLEHKIAAKMAHNPDVELDILRQYLVLFGWIKGLDAVQMADAIGLKGGGRERFLAHVTTLAVHELAQKGFRMLDVKPQHIILRRRRRDHRLLRDHYGQISYAVIDYELLERTPEHEEQVAGQTRRLYSLSRFTEQPVVFGEVMPAHLDRMEVHGVDYLYGHAESTGGRLWVVGTDPRLFNYFLPERWRRTPARRLVSLDEAYLTRTKDHLGLIWRVSNLGMRPRTQTPCAEALQRFGYNTPFEEFAVAHTLLRAGLPVLTPRAIYATGRRSSSTVMDDLSRFERYRGLRTPDGLPLLSPEHAYIMLWDCWGTDEQLPSVLDREAPRGLLDAAEALDAGLVNERELDVLLSRAGGALQRGGFSALDLRPDHLLLAQREHGQLARDRTGRLQCFFWNFEFVPEQVS